jgi:GntR family transcriptional regulator
MASEHGRHIREYLNDKKEHGIPHFVHIHDSVQQMINEKNWEKGEKFGRVDDIAKTFGVTRFTVNRALMPFFESGILIRKRGHGLYINKPSGEPPRISLCVDWKSFLHVIEKSEIQILKNESVKDCPWDLSCFSDIPKEFQHMIRIHDKNGVSYNVIDAYFDSEIYNFSPRLFEDETILGAINKLKPNLIADVKQGIRIKRADSIAARMLRIPIGEPIGEIKRSVADKNGRMIYCGHIIYPGDMVQIDINMGIN